MATRPDGTPFHASARDRYNESRLPPEPAIVQWHRLAPESYEQLSKQCPVIAVNNDTQPLQAGFQLGVQHVLQKLREGFVVGL